MNDNTRASVRRQTAAIATRRAIWFEIGAIVVLSCGPTLSNWGCSLIGGSEYQKLDQQWRDAQHKTATVFETTKFESMVQHLQLVPVVLFVMWRSGEGWACFGLVKAKLGKDILTGFGLWLIAITFVSLINLVAFHQRVPEHRLYPDAISWHRAMLLIANCCAIGFSEELRYRAYLIPRLEAVTGSTWKSAVISVVVFGFVHLYQGYLGVIDSVVTAVLFSIGFCLTRRIWPVALAHAVTNFIIYTHASSHLGL